MSMDKDPLDFLESDAGKDRPSPDLEIYTGPDCSETLVEIERACVNGDLDTMKRVFATLRSTPGCEIYLKQRGSGLSYAVKRQHRGIVEYLLSEGVEPGINHVQVATYAKDTSFLEMCLEHGWDINGEQNWATAPLMEIAVEDEQLTSWYLAHGANPNAECQCGSTPLSAAVQYAPFQVIKMLVAHGGSFASGNLLQFAARRDLDDQLQVVKYVLDNGGRSKINHVLNKDNAFRYKIGEAFALGTALHEAAARGRLEVVKMLVANGADPRIKDSRGETALQRAEYGKHGPVIDYLRHLMGERSQL